MALSVRRGFFSLVVLGVVGLMVDGVSAAPLRIMPVGDSITAGYTNATWSDPFTFGYRGPLYTRLTNAGYDFQFVGSSAEPWVGPWPPPPTVLGPDLRTLGQDNHRGYGGTVISQITNGSAPGNDGIVANLNADNPDIVLLMIGINDISYFGNTGNPTEVEARLNTLVQTIVNTKPDIELIVAQIAPRSTGDNTDPVSQYNDYIKNTLVPYYAAQGKHVTTVDQYAHFVNPDGTVNVSMYAASALHHPNVTGYDRMAETWFTGIQSVGIPEPSTLVLAGIGLLAWAGYLWRKRRRS